MAKAPFDTSGWTKASAADAGIAPYSERGTAAQRIFSHWNKKQKTAAKECEAVFRFPAASPAIHPRQRHQPGPVEGRRQRPGKGVFLQIFC